jgi:hypothetical protein
MVNKQDKLLSNVKVNVPKESKKKNIKKKVGGDPGDASSIAAAAAVAAARKVDPPALAPPPPSPPPSPPPPSPPPPQSPAALTPALGNVNSKKLINARAIAAAAAVVASVEEEHLKLAEELNTLLKHLTNQQICDNKNIDKIKIILDIIKTKFNEKNVTYDELFGKINSIIQCPDKSVNIHPLPPPVVSFDNNNYYMGHPYNPNY